VVQPAEGVAGTDELAAELMAFCRDHLAHFKCPRSFDFVAELPREDTGKIFKRKLRDQYRAKQYRAASSPGRQMPHTDQTKGAERGYL
jgi:acyl-coenzyme A synthetase/AMP-(fatty) acid ligase